MNKMLMTMVVVLAMVSLKAMTLVEARGKTDAVIAKPAEMTTVMQQLSAADQKAFVASVNEAISKMPGSAEEKSAVALNVARAALSGAARGNAVALIAEIFATAPVEALTIINEAFAKDVLNRSGDPSKGYSDKRFTELAKTMVAKVVERVSGTDDAGVRGAFAALMMVRASNGSPATLADELADMLGEDAEAAKREWLPAALGADSNYDNLIAATTAEKVPNPRVSLMIAGPQRQELLLSALGAGDLDLLATVNDGFGDFSQVQTTDQGVYTLPRTTDKTKKWNPDYKRGDPTEPAAPYDGQNPGNNP